MTSAVSKAFPDLHEVNELAAELAREQAGALIKDLTVTKQKQVARLVERALDEGWTDAKLADRIAERVGLSDRYAAAVDNFRASGKAAPSEVRKYAKRLRRYRALLIAKTEIHSVLSKAQRMLWTQQQEDGDLTPYAVRITRVRKDGKHCKTCRAQNGRRHSLRRDKQQGGPPFHPNCRCYEEIEDLGIVKTDPSLVGVRIDRREAIAKRDVAFKPDAKDGDGDGKVQDGTPFERPASTDFGELLPWEQLDLFEDPPKDPEDRRLLRGDALGDALVAFAERYDHVTPQEIKVTGDRMQGGAINFFVARVRHKDRDFVVKHPGMEWEVENEEIAGMVSLSMGLPFAAVGFGRYSEGDDEGGGNDGADMRKPHQRMVATPFIDGVPGMMSQYSSAFTDPKEIRALTNSLEIAVLDFLVGNTDRHSGNWIVARDSDGNLTKEVVPIDHGFLDLEDDSWLDDEDGGRMARYATRMSQQFASASIFAKAWFTQAGYVQMAKRRADFEAWYADIEKNGGIDSEVRDVILDRLDLLFEKMGWDE